MAVKESSDNHLRKLGFNDKLTIVKYDNDTCAYCKQLEEPYEKLSNSAEFCEVLFLRIKASENPVARHEVELKKMPFISIYIQGLLIDCGCVRSEKGITRFLEKLIKAERSREKTTMMPTLE
ncbi:MAG TPA: thioredoxin domain-containing protein [Bacteroidia bacterium]|jgi:thiol-disulfide isomerase/thioredoxin